MTQSQARLGCGLAVAAPVLFLATFAAAGVEVVRGRPLVAGHMHMWSLLGGLAFVAVGASVVVFFGPYAAFGRTAVGRVVSVGPDDDSDEGPLTVVWYAAGGSEHEITTRGIGAPTPGARVNVSYLRTDPADGRLTSRARLLGLLIGPVLVALGVANAVTWFLVSA